MSTSNALPWMGLGLSSNLDASQRPHPYRLLNDRPELFDFVEYSAPLELEEARAHASLFAEMFERRLHVPVLFHPVHLNLFGPHLEDPERLAQMDAHARAVGSPWVGNDIGWWHVGGEPFPGYLYIPPPLNAAGLQDAVTHAEHVKAHLSVPLVLENPAVIAVRGGWHVLDFMAEVHARTGCPLLLDLGHLLSHQLARGLPLDAGFDGFPFDRVAEIHIAGGVVTRAGGRGVYVDDHTQPVREELFSLLETALPRCTNLRAVVFEGDGHPEEVAALTLHRLRALVPPRPREQAPPPGTRSGSSIHPSALQVDAAALFEESYGLRPPQEDPQGVNAELDFRLALVAQVVDAAYPITRLLLAGTREGLLAFCRSAEFRACFEEGQRTVPRAFFAWAAARIREGGEAAGEAVLAVESLRQRGPGGARVPVPVALTEVEFAARALRRHLAGRAWVSGSIDFSGLEALWQVVRRAPRQLPR